MPLIPNHSLSLTHNEYFIKDTFSKSMKKAMRKYVHVFIHLFLRNFDQTNIRGDNTNLIRLKGLLILFIVNVKFLIPIHLNKIVVSVYFIYGMFFNQYEGL